jgi:hypothetical protein
MKTTSRESWSRLNKFLAIILVLVLIGLVVFFSMRMVQSNDREDAGIEPESKPVEKIIEDTATVPVAGPAGRAPNADEILRAVGIYCSAPSNCVGPRGPVGPGGEKGDVGPAGSPGKDGVNGSAGIPGKDGIGVNGKDGSPGPAGPQGEKGADSTVPGPQGPAGANGVNGTNGLDGRGIDRVECAPVAIGFVLVFTYTDGSAQQTNASCVPVD